VLGKKGKHCSLYSTGELAARSKFNFNPISAIGNTESGREITASMECKKDEQTMSVHHTIEFIAKYGIVIISAMRRSI